MRTPISLEKRLFSLSLYLSHSLVRRAHGQHLRKCLLNQFYGFFFNSGIYLLNTNTPSTYWVFTIVRDNKTGQWEIGPASLVS